MQVQKINNQNYNNTQTNFGARLSIINKNKTLPFTEQGIKAIEDLFEKSTKRVSGELELVSDKRKLLFSDYNDGTYWELNFKNNNHKDSIDGYMQNSSNSVEEFTKQIIGFLDIFKSREKNLAVYREISNDYYTGTYNKLNGLGMDVIQTRDALPR